MMVGMPTVLAMIMSIVLAMIMPIVPAMIMPSMMFLMLILTVSMLFRAYVLMF